MRLFVQQTITEYGSNKKFISKKYFAYDKKQDIVANLDYGIIFASKYNKENNNAELKLLVQTGKKDFEVLKSYELVPYKQIDYNPKLTDMDLVVGFCLQE